MRRYTKPEMDIVSIDVKDIIQASTIIDGSDENVDLGNGNIVFPDKQSIYSN